MTDALPYSILVLAAGRSQRMGGPNKLLLPLGDEPIIRHTVRHAVSSRAADVLVVTGHEMRDVENALHGLPARMIENSDHAAGMASSLRAGIRAIAPQRRGCVVMLGDMPLVDATLVNAVMMLADANPAASAVVPRLRGAWAHPVLLARALFRELDMLTGDHGARGLLKARADVVFCETLLEGAMLDADTPAAYESLRAAFAEEQG